MSELKPPDYLSASSILTFEQCPLKYRFSRIDGMREDPTEATLLGNFVHDILEDLYNLPNDERTLERAKSIARHQWESSWGSQISEWVPTDKLNKVRWGAWWCIENLWKLENPQSINPEGCETEVNVAIAGVNVKGFVDRWSKNDSGNIVVTDYKSGKTPQPRYQVQKYVQLIIYALALEEMGVGKVEEVELLFLKDGDRLRRKVNSEDAFSVTKMIVDTREQIDKRCISGNFEAKPSRLCDWCSFKPICPYWK